LDCRLQCLTHHLSPLRTSTMPMEESDLSASRITVLLTSSCCVSSLSDRNLSPGRRLFSIIFCFILSAAISTREVFLMTICPHSCNNPIIPHSFFVKCQLKTVPYFLLTIYQRHPNMGITNWSDNIIAFSD